MQRISLEEVVLQVLSLKLGSPYTFLQQCLQPPSLTQLQDAIATLIALKAVELHLPSSSSSSSNNSNSSGATADAASTSSMLQLTALGYHLGKLPMNVKLGKMLIYGALFGIAREMTMIAACLSSQSASTSNATSIFMYPSNLPSQSNTNSGRLDCKEKVKNFHATTYLLHQQASLLFIIMVLQIILQH